MPPRVRVVTTASPEVVRALTRLVPQLSSTASRVDRARVEAVVSSPSTVLLVCSDDDGAILGSATLVVCQLPTRVRAWIEDVVVDSSARRRGFGAALTEAAIDQARLRGAAYVDLTSNPTRISANRLYEKLGFVKRDTSVYRFFLS